MYNFIQNIADKIYSGLAIALGYIAHDDQFLAVSGETTRDIFIITSLLLLTVMVIARPSNLLDVSLTLREIFLSSLLISAIIAKREHILIPQWYIIGHYYFISVVGVLTIWAIVREYFYSYWVSKSKKKDGSIGRAERRDAKFMAQKKAKEQSVDYDNNI